VNGVCSDFNEVTVTFLQPPTTAVAGSDVFVCADQTNLAGNSPVVGTGTWTFVSNPDGLGIIANPSDPLSLIDGTQGQTYTLRWTISNGVCPASIDDVSIEFRRVPDVLASPSARTICSGDNSNLTLSNPNAVAGTVFNWTVVQSGVTGASAGTGTVVSQVLTTTAALQGTATYTITPVANSCSGAPITVIVTVDPLPNAAASPQTICSGDISSVGITNPNSVPGTTYTWVVFSNPGGVLGAAAGSGATLSQLLTNPSNTDQIVTYRITPKSGAGCDGPTTDVQVTVRPQPTVQTSPNTSIICSGATTSVSITNPNNVVGTSFSWTVSQTGVAGASAGGGSTIAQTLSTTAAVPGTATYSITPLASGCSGPPTVVTVTVNPLPSVTSANVTICSESLAVFNLNPGPQNVAGTTFAWTVTTSGVVSGQSSGNGSLISQQLTTNSLGAIVTYHVTPTANSCNGPVSLFTATVNPKATVNAGADFAVCEPATVPINGALGGSSSSANWSVITGSGSLAATGINDVYTVNALDVGGSVTLRLTSNDPDGAGPCPIATDDLVIAINRSAQVTAPADYTLCEPASFVLNSSLTGSATTGAWSLIAGSGTLSFSSTSGTGPYAVSSTYFPALSDVSNSLQFRITTNDPDGAGPCTPVSDDVIVTINESAKVNAGSDFSVCEDENLLLNGSLSGSASASTWTGGSGAARFNDINDPTTQYNLTTTEFNALNQSFVFRLTTNDPDGAGPCTAVFDEVNVVVHDTTQVVFFGLNSVYAENQPPVTLLPNPIGGIFTGPGITAGTSIFTPAFANIGTTNTIIYTYINPITTCSSIYQQSTIVNPVTSIDFDLDDGSDSDKGQSSSLVVCAEIGDVRLAGFPDVNSPNARPVTEFRSVTPGLIAFDGTNYFVKTDGLPAGSYFITYQFTNQFFAATFLTKQLIVYSAPVAVITVDNACIEDVIQFESTASSIPNNLSGAVIDEYFWDFDDQQNQSAAPNPTYTYDAEGLYNVMLKVTTDQGCFDNEQQVLRVGRPPSVNFTWQKVCNGDLTEFTNFTDPGISPIASVRWDFGDGSSIVTGPPGNTVVSGDGLTTGNYLTPVHKFVNPGAYSITQTVTSVDGCQSDSTKNAFILASSTATQIQSNGYRETFEAGQGTWFPTNKDFENVTATSWKFGVPNGTSIADPSTTAWYMTSYLNQDNSTVIGPCLDLTQLIRPMISLDFWVDTDTKLDGAVVQFSTDEGITWQTVGTNNGEGIDWYNNAAITGNPGGQSFGQYGWGGQSGKWVNARFNLDQIPTTERDKVVFRIAFGSNNPSTDRTFNGFAFDNIYIGDKNKLVLIEHFTNNASLTSRNTNDEIDLAYNAEIAAKGSADFFKLQYHIANPGQDEFNLNNPADPSVRSFYYSVDQPPYTIMNGFLGNYTVGSNKPFQIGFNGLYSRILPTVIDREALRAPKFNISLTLDAQSPLPAEDKIEYDITVTYADSIATTFSDPVNVHIALFESVVVASQNPLQGATFKNVFRKFLTGGGGITINQISPPWTWNGVNSSSATRSGFSDLDIQFQNTNNLFVVAFVQNKNTREIYQAVIQKVLNPKVGLQLVPVDNSITKAELESIEIYPNPASNKVNLFAEGLLSQQYGWKIITQQGVEVLSGMLDREFTDPKQIDLSSLADGIYYVVLGLPEKPLVHRKLAVINQR
jgi:hypothetical protein